MVVLSLQRFRSKALLAGPVFPPGSVMVVFFNIEVDLLTVLARQGGCLDNFSIDGLFEAC